MHDDLTTQCAANVMDTFHLMMRTIRPEGPKDSPPGLTMQEFRTMMMIMHHGGASLSEVSKRLGVTLSAASKQVDGLVAKGFIRRGTAKDDRRRLMLTLTPAGTAMAESVRLEVVEALAERLASLSPNEMAMLNVAMDVLRAAIVPTHPSSTKEKQK